MILITGSTGRIGNVLIRELSKTNKSIRILVRKTSDLSPIKDLRFEKIYGDILDYNSVKKAVSGCKFVYHLAGKINISNKNKDLTFDTNIQGTKNVIKACEESNVKRLLYTSSIHAFEAPKSGHIITEDTELCDNNGSRGVYDQSKALATKEILKSKLNAVIVCPTGVVGPYDYRPSFFGQGMIDSVKSKLKNSVPGAYDYVDVRDVVNGILCAMNKGRKKQLYILGGEKITMKEYFKYLQEFTDIHGIVKTLKYDNAILLGKLLNFFSNKSSITPYSIETLMSNSNISHEKAYKELGFKPRCIKDSLLDQYIWFKENSYI